MELLVYKMNLAGGRAGARGDVSEHTVQVVGVSVPRQQGHGLQWAEQEPFQCKPQGPLRWCQLIISR